jgi:hypothetical protein
MSSGLKLIKKFDTRRDEIRTGGEDEQHCGRVARPTVTSVTRASS